MSNQNPYKELIGSWTTAVGTIIAALGVTPAIIDGGFFLEDELSDEMKGKYEKLSEHLVFVGNTFQAVGNATEATGEKPYSLEKVGEIIQVAGNTTVLFSIDTEGDENRRIILDITGNAVQAFGGLLAGIDELKDYEDDFYIDAIGNFLQSIGNTIQAIGGVVLLKLEDEELSKLLIYSGSWIQSGGAIVSAAATTMEIAKSSEDNSEEDVVRRYGYGYRVNKIY